LVFDKKKKKYIYIAHYITSNNHVLPLSPKTGNKTYLATMVRIKKPVVIDKNKYITSTNKTYVVMGRSFREAD